MKKYGFILICLLAGAVAASAQQITRFAVVDTSRIYTTFLRDSRSVRDYQTKQAKYQAETQRNYCASPKKGGCGSNRKIRCRSKISG